MVKQIIVFTNKNKKFINTRFPDLPSRSLKYFQISSPSSCSPVTSSQQHIQPIKKRKEEEGEREQEAKERLAKAKDGEGTRSGERSSGGSNGAWRDAGEMQMSIAVVNRAGCWTMQCSQKKSSLL